MEGKNGHRQSASYLIDYLGQKGESKKDEQTPSVYVGRIKPAHVRRVQRVSEQ